MNFTQRMNLTGKHAFLSPSGHTWLNYDEDKLTRRYLQSMDAALGVRLHSFAHEAIQLRIRQEDIQRTLNMYINDGIGFRMDTEVLLYYSDNCFGHADTICFRDNTLRIHDLKNGVNEASMDQLLIYAALFCLNFKMDPRAFNAELRIYQNDNIVVYIPEPAVIMGIMEKIKHFSAIIDRLKGAM